MNINRYHCGKHHLNQQILDVADKSIGQIDQVSLGIGAKNAGDYHLLEKTQRLDQNQHATDRENIFQQTRLHPRVSFQIFKSLLQRLLFVGRSLPA